MRKVELLPTRDCEARYAPDQQRCSSCLGLTSGLSLLSEILIVANKRAQYI